MKLIIPMAGKGTRLRPHTYSKPKPLVKVAGKPVLHHIIDTVLSFAEIDEAIFIISSMEDKIRDSLEGYDFKKSFYYQNELLGDADAISKAEGTAGEAIIVFSDTVFVAESIGINTDMDGIVWTKHVKDPRSFGVVELNGSIISDLVEKPENPKSDLAVIGLYYFKEMEKVLRAISYLKKNSIRSGGEFRLADAIKHMITDGMSFESRTVDLWLDCGKPQALLETNAELLKRKHSNGSMHKAEMKDSVIHDPVFIGKGCTVECSVIGKNVSIGKNAIVRNSIVHNSIIDDNAVIENMLLKDSIIGESADVKGKENSVNIGDNSLIEY